MHGNTGTSTQKTGVVDKVFKRKSTISVIVILKFGKGISFLKAQESF